MTHDNDIQVSVEPIGATPEDHERLLRRLSRSPRLRERAEAGEIRILSAEFVGDDGEKRRGGRNEELPTRFRSTVVDYTANQALLFTGEIESVDDAEVLEYDQVPLPSDDEFQAAVEIVSEDPDLGPRIEELALTPYRPMPPVVVDRELGAATPRTIAVGLLNAVDTSTNEIVGVDMVNRTVVRYPGGAPLTALADAEICNPPSSAGQTTVARGTPGQVSVVISQGGVELWRFVAIRPAASSGTNGSGIELRHVRYRGDLVLYRAHVPILNVSYKDNACGPYRDWQWQEGWLEADLGSDVAPGFRLSSNPVQTIIETGSDLGTFLGVGIHIEGSEVVFTSEMHAGWYRYVSQWRFDVDGTLRPRFGFDAVANSCTCRVHYHHVYWRLDFDVDSAGDNVVHEFNVAPLVGGKHWTQIERETGRDRNAARRRKWHVGNANSGNGYLIVPGENDRTAAGEPDAPFGRGDAWFVRYRGDEIDDGSVAIGPPYEADIDGFVNGQSLHRKDVVVWYAGHFTHDEESGEDVSHIVGPDLIPARHIGRIEAVEGTISLLRAHDVGTRYGPPNEQLDVEAVVQLDEMPDMAYGFQLRNDVRGPASHAMFELLRDAFRAEQRVRIEYTRTGNHSGHVLRVIRLKS